VFIDPGVQEIAPQRLQSRERALLIRADQPAIVDHVCGQDGGKAALDAFFGHLLWSPLRAAGGKL
jgi:hypothetical protein